MYKNLYLYAKNYFIFLQKFLKSILNHELKYLTHIIKEKNYVLKLNVCLQVCEQVKFAKLIYIILEI